MAIRVYNGSQVSPGVIIGSDTLDLTSIDTNTVNLQPDEVAYDSTSTIVIIYDK